MVETVARPAKGIHHQPEVTVIGHGPQGTQARLRRNSYDNKSRPWTRLCPSKSCSWCGLFTTSMLLTGSLDYKPEDCNSR